jgi:hypothetical protein
MNSESPKDVAKDYMTRTIAATDSLTFYTVNGDVFAKALLGGTLIFAFVLLWRERLSLAAKALTFGSQRFSYQKEK